MNEVVEFKTDVPEVQTLPEVPAETAEYNVVQDVWNDFVNSIKEFTDSVFGSQDTNEEIVEAREYGVKECADVAKACFTPEVIQAWGLMDLESRNKIIQEYAEGIGDAMGINFKGIVWEEFPIENGMYTYGYNAGDGYVHLNVDMLADPGQLMHIVDTVAHEARHQLQNEAIENPSKFPIDEATINEWTVGRQVYTLDMPSAYDPWGYTYNPMETDAKYFGEAMVRELTKAIINNA
jgi:hypothetical protein